MQALNSPRIAVALVVFGASTFADQLVPVQQTRDVSGSAYAGNPDGTEVTDTDLVSAPDFGPFQEAAIAQAIALEADGVGAANQTSTISSSTVSAYGAGSGGGDVFGQGYGGGDGRAVFELVFDVPVDSTYTLSGFIMATDSGFSEFEFLSGDTVLVAEFAFGPEQTWFLDSSGALPAGQYTLRASADGTGYSDGFSFDYGFGEFDFDFRIDASGTSYCSSVANSQGSAATIGVAGSVSIEDNDFQLQAQGLPAAVTGVFFYGDSQASVAFGPGLRCVGGSLFRVNPPFQAAVDGSAEAGIDFTGQSGAGAIVAGSTWNFQTWYRDPAAGGVAFNTSDAISVTFCP